VADWDGIAAVAEARYRDGEGRVGAIEDPDTRQRQLTRMGNAAGAAVYDRARGRVADGIDGTRVSENSGAESNIVAAEVLLDDTCAVARSMLDPFTA